MAQPSATTKLSAKIADHYAIVAAAGAAVILLVGYLVLFGPALKSVKAADRAAALAVEESRKTAYLAELKQLEANYEAIPEDDVKRIAAMIPLEDDIPGLMATFEALASADDVSVTNMSFAAGTADPKLGGLKVIQISLSLDHVDYEHFKLFLTSLEQHLRIFDVENVSLNPGGAQYIVSLQTYAYPSASK